MEQNSLSEMKRELVRVSRFARFLIVFGLVVIAGANIYLFPWLNGEGFVRSHGGYWPLRVQEQGDFHYLVDTHANRRADTLGFYLNLREHVEGQSVVVPPGVLDPFRVRALSRAEPVISDTYDYVLDSQRIEELSTLPTITGTFFGGPDYVIVLPLSPQTTSYRIAAFDEVIFAIPEPLLTGVEMEYRRFGA